MIHTHLKIQRLFQKLQNGIVAIMIEESVDHILEGKKKKPHIIPFIAMTDSLYLAPFFHKNLLLAGLSIQV